MTSTISDFPSGAHRRDSRREALTLGETRVLDYLPTHLSAREIADELYLSVHTVRTHQRHLYAMLGAQPYAGGPGGPHPGPARPILSPAR